MDVVCSSPASPPICTIYSLCDDILSSIFLWCNQSRPHRPDTSDFDSLSSNASPWVLSYVCHHWRTLILSSPLLWTTIELDIPEYVAFYPGPGTLAAKLKLFLQRSRRLELSVRIYDSKQKVYDSARYERIRELLCSDSIIPLLLPTTNRWRHLEMAAFMDLVEEFEGYPFKRLRSLSVSQNDDDPITFIQNTPSLTELKITGQVDIDLWQWSGIQTFTAVKCTLPYSLPQMVGLRVLNLEHATMDLASFPPSFVLPSLHFIRMQVHHQDDLLSDLPGCLCAPALDTLELIIWNSHDRLSDLHSTHFPAFDTIDNVVNLSIDFECCTDDAMPFLSTIPSVTSLYLGPDTATPAVIEVIEFGALPKLKKLCLHISTLRMHTEHFIIMLESRTRRPGAAITEIQFSRLRLSVDMGDTNSGDAGFELLSREALALNEELGNRWEALRKSVNVSFIERHSF